MTCRSASVWVASLVVGALIFLASPSADAQQSQSLSTSASATAKANTTFKGTVTLTDAWTG
jgi:hypothetical protein